MKKYQKPLIILITIVFMILIIANVSMKDVINGLFSIGIGTFLLCLLIHFFVYLIRSITMSVFLKKEVPFFYLLISHLIHNFYLNIVPASMGELSLPLLLNKFVSKTRTFTVLLITRGFSFAMFCLLFLISVFIIFGKYTLININYKHLSLSLAALLVIYILYLLLRKTNIVNKVFIVKIKEKLLKLKMSFVFSIKKELVFSRILSLSLLTLAYITFLALFFKVLLVKLNISVSFIELYYIMSLQLAILVLPIKSFGGFGTTEGAWMIGLMSLGIDKKIALESGIIMHIINLASAAIFFALGLLAKYYYDKKLALSKI